MLRGSLTCVRVTTPAEVEVRLVLGVLNCGEFVALNASARNWTFQRSWSVTALNREISAFGTLGGRIVGNSPLNVRAVLEYCWMKATGRFWPLKVQFCSVPLVSWVHVLKNFESLPLDNAGLIPLDQYPPGAASGNPFSRTKMPLACQPCRNTPATPFVCVKIGSAQLPLITMRLGVSVVFSVRSGVAVMPSCAFRYDVALSHFSRV